MGRFPLLTAGAVLSCIATVVSADTVALAITPPLPVAQFKLPELSNPKVVRFETPTVEFVSGWDQGWSKPISEQADISAFGFPCLDSVNTTALPNAMVQLEISATCRPSQTVTIVYSGMQFEQTLSMTGNAVLEIPMIEYSTEIDSIFDDYSVHSIKHVAPELSDYARVAVQWDGPDPANLERKAPKHLPTDVITLGDGSGSIVEILSHHIDPDSDPGVIRLSVNAPVTTETCRTERHGKVLRLMPGQPPVRYALTLAAAGCDWIGTNLELKNILQDLKLARN